MAKLKLYCLTLFLMASCSSETQEPDDTKDLQIATDISELVYQPEMVAPYIISKAYFEGHASITPSGNEMYFTVYTNDHSYSTIVYSKKYLDSWTEPEIVSFSGSFSDGSPALSPNGDKLFFSSRRPVDNSEVLNPSNDIWYVERIDQEWGEPKRLPANINTEFNEFSPSVDRDGNLYFSSNRPGGFGDMDIYYSEFRNGEYQEPVLLDGRVNSEYHEGNVGVSPDGKMLFVMVQHKPGDFGYDDIHYSVKTKEGWSDVKNIGPVVNTYSYDFSPKVSPDGKTLYFSSRVNRDYNLRGTKYSYSLFEKYLNSPLNGLGNIYRIELSELGLENE